MTKSATMREEMMMSVTNYWSHASRLLVLLVNYCYMEYMYIHVSTSQPRCIGLLLLQFVMIDVYSYDVCVCENIIL